MIEWKKDSSKDFFCIFIQGVEEFLLSLTCDDQTFIMIQGFSEEARNNKLRVDQKTDFLLD